MVRRAAFVFAAGLALAATPAAHADEEAPKKKKLIVTVDDNEDTTTVVKKKKAATATPEPGASEAEIIAYIRELRKDVRSTQAELNAARASDDADSVLRLREELKEKKQFLKEEESRLYSKDSGLIAGGAVLTALGGISLVSSFVLVIVWPLTAIDGNIEDEYGWGALGCLGGGVLGLSAGIPMIVAGNKRTVTGADEFEEASWQLPTPGRGPTAGLTLRFSF